MVLREMDRKTRPVLENWNYPNRSLLRDCYLQTSLYIENFHCPLDTSSMCELLFSSAINGFFYLLPYNSTIEHLRLMVRNWNFTEILKFKAAIWTALFNLDGLWPQIGLFNSILRIRVHTNESNRSSLPKNLKILAYTRKCRIFRVEGGVKQEYGGRSQNKIVSGVLAKEFREVFSQEGKEGWESSSKQYNLNAARFCLQTMN